MQSLASLMSLDKITDIGQLKDVEADEDEGGGGGVDDAAARISALASEINFFSSTACNDDDLPAHRLAGLLPQGAF